MALCGFLRLGTAVDILLGPCIDDATGKDAENGLSLDVEISKNGQGLANKTDATVPVVDDGGTVDGYYNCELDETDTGTIGIITVVAHAAGFLPVRQDYQIIAAIVYDSLFAAAATDYLPVDVIQIGGVAQSATDLKDLADTGYDPSTHKVAGVVTVDTTTTNTDMRGTDSAATAAVLGAAVGASISADIAAVKAETGAITAAGPTKAQMDAAHALLATPAQVATELGTYDAPTRAELTTDKNSIITEVNANETKIDSAQADITTIMAKTDLLPSEPAKNVALANFTFLMVLSTDHVTPATGKTIASEICKDGGAFAATTNSVSEIGDGFYKISLTQTEMNANVIGLKFTETDCDQRSVVMLTST